MRQGAANAEESYKNEGLGNGSHRGKQSLETVQSVCL